MDQVHPIGVFDSGYGGLTVLKEIVKQLPQYDYLYLGDNARAPYGTRSFDTVYRYTWQCVQWFLEKGCPLVILACNTASAKALRNIQQKNLHAYPGKKVLGVIRPTTEQIGHYSKTGTVGILATNGTVQSQSYPIEISKLFPDLKVYQEACPMWVPLIENNEFSNAGADYFIHQHIHNLLKQAPEMDTVLLACTHYPLIQDRLQQFLPEGVNIISQGEIVAARTLDYLYNHPDVEARLTKNGKRLFFTTDSPADFDAHAQVFYGEKIHSRQADLV